MNCGLQSDNHKHSPNQRIHIEVFHFVFWLAIELLSKIRADFQDMWNVSTRCVEVVRPLRVVVDDFGIVRGKCPCTFVRFCISLPHLRTRRGVILVCTSSGRFHCTDYEIRTLLTGFDALERGAVEELAAERATWFNVGFDFATIVSSPVPC